MFYCSAGYFKDSSYQKTNYDVTKCRVDNGSSLSLVSHRKMEVFCIRFLISPFYTRSTDTELVCLDVRAYLFKEHQFSRASQLTSCKVIAVATNELVYAYFDGKEKMLDTDKQNGVRKDGVSKARFYYTREKVRKKIVRINEHYLNSYRNPSLDIRTLPIHWSNVNNGGSVSFYDFVIFAVCFHPYFSLIMFFLV